MSLIRKPLLESPKFTSEYIPLTAGTYLARCVQVIDLGKHIEEFNGISKEKSKLRIVWELPTENTKEIEINGKKIIQPTFFGKEFSISFYESSNFRQMLASWRGRDFTDDELDIFDIKNLLDKPCLLNLIVKTSEKSGKQYNILAGISPLMKGQICADRISELVHFDLSENNADLFNNLPKFLQQKILESKEMSEE